MTEIIRVDHEALTKVAGSFGKESAATAQMLQQVTQAMQKLQNGGWMGRGSEAFFNEMEQKIIPAVRRLIEALAEADRTTKAISQTMKGADEEASSGFRQDITNSGGGGGSDLGNTNGGAGGPVSGGVGSGGSTGGALGNNGGSDLGNTIGGAGGPVGGGSSSGSGGTAGGGGSSDGGSSDGAFSDSGSGSSSGGNDLGNTIGGAGGPVSGGSSSGAGDAFGDGFNDSFTGGGSALGDSYGGGSGDYGAGTGLYDGGLGMAADDINSLLDSGSSLWGDDGLFGGGSFGDMLDDNFFPGDYGNDYGSDYGSGDYFNDPSGGSYLGNDPFGFDASSDYGIPSDWLSGVNDSLSDYLQGNYNDYGIPRDWLDEFREGLLADVQSDGLSDSSQSSDTGGGGSSGGGSGGGPSDGGGEPTMPETTPTTDSATGGGSGSGGGMGSGTPSSLPTSGLGSGGAGRGMPSDFGRPTDFPGHDFTDLATQTDKAPPGPVRFVYQSPTGGSVGGEQAGRVFTSFGAGGGVQPAPQVAQANMGLPLSLAAVSPFVALLGKALQRKSNER